MTSEAFRDLARFNERHGAKLDLVAINWRRRKKEPPMVRLTDPGRPLPTVTKPKTADPPPPDMTHVEPDMTAKAERPGRGGGK